MSTLKSLVMTLLMVILLSSSGAAQYYYGGGNEIPLQIDSSRIVIRFDDEFGAQQQQTILAGIGRIDSVTVDDHALDGFQVCALASSQGYEAFLDSVQQIDGVYLVEPYYLNSLDSAFPVGMTFCVAFGEDITASQIDSINALYGVTIDHEITGMANVIVLRNTDTSGYRLLDLANEYYGLLETRYSHPEFGFWVHKQSYNLYDYYHNYQPHTKKVIGEFNSASVWDFSGVDDTSIVVAVIDDGVEAHEDLPTARILSGIDFAQNDLDPTPGDTSAHGMGCAGIIGASHTTDSIGGLASSSGMISLDPLVSIMPVKIFNDDGSGAGVTAGDLAMAITYAYATGADVLSNSWGYGISCPVSGDQFDVLNEAIANAANLGRGGLGCPVIFAAGNGYPYLPDVLYPACLPDAFAVGATELDDDVWYYSCRGGDLELVAPSGDVCLQGDVWSLDRMANLGYNPQKTTLCEMSVTWNCGPTNDVDYDCNFGGTSAACPVVSGIAALILAKDPTLTSAEVYDILLNSAVTDLESGTITPPDDDYGYGRVDAFRAILSISHTGDVNNSGAGPDIADLVYLVNYMFNGGPDIFPSVLMADFNCDGSGADIADLVQLKNYMFSDGPAPENPCFDFGD